MPSDITGTEVIQEDKLDRPASFQVPAWTALRQRDPGRRNQPHAAENAGRPARGDAGAPGHRRRQQHQLPDPFFVLATQNPIEQEGTYPLPEAQLDRFMFNILVDYPDEEEEFHIVRRRRPTYRRRSNRRSRARTSWTCRTSSARCRWPSRHPLRHEVHPADAAGKRRRARLRQGLRHLGRRAAGQPVPGAGGQGAGGAARPVSMSPLRRHSRGRHPRCCGIASSPTSTPKPKGSSPIGSFRS